jgi:ATP phosphoribosyltransferase
MLTVALPKGALLKQSIALFQSIGLDFSSLLDPGNRQLQIPDPTGQAEGLLVRAQDVPVYVEYGQAQLGVVGYDVLREKKPQVAQLVDLGFGHCRMSVAVKQDSGYHNAREIPAHSRVASKFIHCAHDFFYGELELPVEIIPLYGSVELGPITGMSEAIVDLVSTGRTLQENGLVELDVLYESTARLIAHPLSYRLDADRTQDWVQALQDAVQVAV